MSELLTGKPESIVNAMSVDVEDYFQVSAFENHIPREKWDNFEWRVRANTDRVLDLFSAANVKGTFFMLGCVAERFPELTKRIVAEGHELASHGYAHQRVTELTPESFKQDLLKTKGILEDQGGVRVLGFRAPSYSIGRQNLWALDVLQETGHRYSSSIYPIRHDTYGMPEAPRFRFKVKNSELIEIPVTTVRMAGHSFPCGGGGYFRLMPYPLSRWAIRRVNGKDRQPTVFYFHPWEIDPDQPRQSEINWKSRFRHYVNLGRMEERLVTLLQDFKWGRIDNVFLRAEDRDLATANDGVEPIVEPVTHAN